MVKAKKMAVKVADAFNTGSNRYLLKLARESVQGSSATVMDFRVRVLIT